MPPEIPISLGFIHFLIGEFSSRRSHAFSIAVFAYLAADKAYSAHIAEGPSTALAWAMTYGLLGGFLLWFVAWYGAPLKMLQ